MRRPPPPQESAVTATVSSRLKFNTPRADVLASLDVDDEMGAITCLLSLPA